MKVINLSSVEKSDIKYRIDRFPDGEVQFVLTEEINRKEEYIVECRITNAEELFILLQVGDILDRQGVIWNLQILYLMGMRMDRVMSFERPFTLKVVGKMISQMGYQDCAILEAHSERTMLEIRNSVTLDYNPYKFLLEHNMMGVDLVFPDEGALKRYGYKEGTEPKKKKKKERDIETGRIKSFNLKNKNCFVNDGKKIMLYDDLCDAGGTFLGELKVLKEMFQDAEFYIKVTHIVNEVGFDNLCQNFDKVFATESYRDWGKVAEEKGYTNFVVI